MTTVFKDIDEIIWIEVMIPSKMHADNLRILKSLVL